MMLSALLYCCSVLHNIRFLKVRVVLVIQGKIKFGSGRVEH